MCSLAVIGGGRVMGWRERAKGGGGGGGAMCPPSGRGRDERNEQTKEQIAQ